MNNIKLYDKIRLIEDYVEEKSTPKNDTIYKKGSIGNVVELLNNGYVMVELNYKEYKECLINIPSNLIEKI